MSKIDNIINVVNAKIAVRADAIIINNQIFTFKNTGLTRRVYENADKTLVIKVPVDKIHQRENDNEADLWEKANEETRKQLAETKKLSNGYILQEYLHTMDDPDTQAWLARKMTMAEVRFATSCRNDVGYDANQTLKCYDYDEFKAY